MSIEGKCLTSRLRRQAISKNLAGALLESYVGGRCKRKIALNDSCSKTLGDYRYSSR